MGARLTRHPAQGIPLARYALAAGPRVSGARPDRGFTILEVLVVLVIISILATMAVLSMGGLGTGGAKLDEQMRRFTSLMDLAAEQALMQGRDLGLRVEERSYRFMVFDPDSRSWVEMEGDELFRQRELPESVHVQLILEGRDVAVKQGEDDLQVMPQVMIMASGELTPFELIMDSETAGYRYLISGLPFGGIDVELEDMGFR